MSNTCRFHQSLAGNRVEPFIKRDSRHWKGKGARSVLVYMSVFISFFTKGHQAERWETTNTDKTVSLWGSLWTNKRKLVFFAKRIWNHAHLRLCVLSVHTHTRLPCERGSWQLTAKQPKPLKAPETRASGQDITQQQQTTALKIRNRLSLGAALTNSMHCVIKLANALLPLCDTERVESPRGKPVGESPLSDKHYYGHGQERLSIMRMLLCSFIV